MRSAGIPMPAPALRDVCAASASPSNSAWRRVAGQSRNSPGAGSSTGSSRVSVNVTELAPHSKQAASAASASSSRSSRLNCRKEREAKAAAR